MKARWHVKSCDKISWQIEALPAGRVTVSDGTEASR